MKSVSVEFARELIDFAPTRKTKELGFGESQLHGTVAAHNMLAKNKIAYVADEVGLGKTYVALGVLGLLRHVNPTARVVIVAPRENIQHKWVKELTNFVRSNWLEADNCVKGLDGKPVHPPLVCGSIHDLAAATRVNEDRDFLLRMTSFSASVKTSEARKKLRDRLITRIPWISPRVLRSNDPLDFRDRYARVLNAVVPDIDLLIVDEAHNLKHGFGPKVSNRNRVMGLAFGHPDGFDEEFAWYRKHVERALLLSATPFEYDYGDIYHQLDVLGFSGASVYGAHDDEPIRVKQLANPDLEEEKKEIASRLLVRRMAHMNMAGKKYSKNMYRREWRQGGLQSHGEPLQLDDAKQRLIVGLVQKKVAEILGDRRFNNSFQIGMLSSFESFLESLRNMRRRRRVVMGEDGEPKVFDGNQEATDDERRGVDTAMLELLVTSYRREFGDSIPHPKLDATAAALEDAFDTGDKALVFVRRVATVRELKAKLDARFDEWVYQRMIAALPNQTADIDKIFRRYHAEHEAETQRQQPEVAVELEGDDAVDEQEVYFEDDEGGTDTFFAWFFRGDGPRGIHSGAAFQKNRLASLSSVYATLFEEDYVSWLLARPDDVLGALAEELKLDRSSLSATLKQQAYNYFRHRSKQKSGYPRYYVVEAYQASCLRLLEQHGGDLGHRATVVLDERFEMSTEAELEVPARFPGPEEGIGINTVITELVKRPELREAIWPEDEGVDFRERFRRREQRRELISALARLGAAFIDLYLVGIRRLGSFAARAEDSVRQPELRLAQEFLDLLEAQAKSPSFGAYHELSRASEAFDTILSVNFPDIHYTKLPDLTEAYGNALGSQMPVGGMAGGVNKRLVTQFRMPGFPLVLATTDVLQEGEDLHTFCKRVVHYGITWTPSAMEQRTGRVDRIGSLTQRLLDGRATAPQDEELIQVYYPHLRDTIEVLQVRRVLERLNRFLTMIHRSDRPSNSDDSRIDVAHEALRVLKDIPQIEGLLESAFPVKHGWLAGELGPEHTHRPNIEALEDHLEEKWHWLVDKWGIESRRTDSRRRYRGIVTLVSGQVVNPTDIDATTFTRRQPFELEMGSQVSGSATLLHCVSPVGELALDNFEIDKLYDLQRELGLAKVCIKRSKHGRYDVTVKGDRLFHLDTTQVEEIERLVIKTARIADILEHELLQDDQSPYEWRSEEAR